MNQQIIRAKTLIAELNLNNRPLTNSCIRLGICSPYRGLWLEQIHRTHTTRKSDNVLLAVNMTEEEPPKPPPDEDESEPPVKEPPTEEPPVKEPPPNNS